MKKSTTMVKKQEAQRNWALIDVDGKVVGRAATKIAAILRGKHRASFTPNVDNGDFVVVINAEKIKLTGKKMDNKHYYHHTGYPGGIKDITAAEHLAKHPDRILRSAVWGMMPKNYLSRHMMTKLKIYAGTDHPHSAQTPTTVAI